MMSTNWWYCLLVVITACHSTDNGIEEFQYRLLNEFIKAKEISMLDKKFTNQGDLIVGSPLSWITLVTARQFSFDHQDPATVCLAYRIPSVNDKKYQSGILQMIKTQNATCPTYYTKNDLALNEIKQLQLIKKADAIELRFFFGDKINQRSLTIPIINEDKKESQIIYMGYGEKIDLPEIRKRTHGALIKPGEKCFDINSRCEIIKADQCFECEFGYFEVAGGSCKQGGIKLCSPVDCGMKNGPACMRSKKIDGENWCYQDSKAGFCADGLSPHCGNEGYLICL